MRMTALCTLACAAAFALLPGAARAQISDGVVRVGVLTDLSGAHADLAGAGAVLATRMAIEDFVAESRPGFRVEMVYADHRNAADVAAGTARAWFEREGVDVVTELVSSTAALAVMNVAREMGRITLMSGPGAMAITNAQCSALAVHYTYDAFALVNAAVKALAGRDAGTLFVLAADHPFGRALEKDASALADAAGGTVLGAARHPVPAEDLAPFLAEARSSGARVVALASTGDDARKSIEQAAEGGLAPGQSLAALSMFITDVHALGLQRTQGMYLGTGFYWDRNAETRAWSRRFFEGHRRMPTMVQAGQYSSVRHYLRAVRAAGTDEAAKVMAQMKATPVNDFFAREGRIREDGRMVHDVYLVEVKTPDASAYPWDYYHVRQTIPANEAFLPLAQSGCPLVGD